MLQPDIARTILQYIADRPDSGDTLEGIMTWWIMHENITQKMTEVSAALELLVERGVLVENTAHNRPSTFVVNKEIMMQLELTMLNLSSDRKL